MTNAEAIRQMSDEELADFLESWELGDIDYAAGFCDLCYDSGMTCHNCRLIWLQKEQEQG